MKGRTLLTIVIAVVSGLVGSLLTQFLIPVRAQWKDVIQADQFRLVDFRGVDRARLGLSGGDQQYTYLYLMDQDGKIRVRLTVHPDNTTPRFEFYDKAERRVATAP